MGMITRDELARRAQGVGLDVTTRTIRYWADNGFMPYPKQLEGRGVTAYYPEEMLNWVQILASIRPQRMQEIRNRLRERCRSGEFSVRTVTLAGETFEVFPRLASWNEGGKKYDLYLLAGDYSGQGLVLRQSTEEDQDELGEV